MRGFDPENKQTKSVSKKQAGSRNSCWETSSSSDHRAGSLLKSSAQPTQVKVDYIEIVLKV